MENVLEIVQTVVDFFAKVVIPLLLAYLAWRRRAEAVIKAAKEALEIGTTFTYREVAYPLKHDKQQRPDGKLTARDREDCREIARNRAMKVAKGAARRLLRKWGKAKMDSYIEEIVARRKKEKTDA